MAEEHGAQQECSKTFFIESVCFIGVGGNEEDFEISLVGANGL